MRDFYATSAAMPLGDQAQGLRRIFAARAGRVPRIIAVAANPKVATSALALDRMAATLSRLGRQVLVVDAAASAPAAHEFSRLDLTAGIEPMGPGVAYLPARGLPLSFVDTRGSAARFIDALFDALPSADVLLLHADAGELARILTRRVARPVLLAADHPESLKQAYAACKLIVQRTRLATFDLVLVASARSPRVEGIVASLRSVADTFIGAVLGGWALVDPAAPSAAASSATSTAPLGAADDAGLAGLLAAQLALEDDAHVDDAAPRLEAHFSAGGAAALPDLPPGGSHLLTDRG